MSLIEDMVRDYEPNEEGTRLLAETPVVLLVGITGAGKNTVLAEMLKTDEFHDLITTVTRKPRYNNGLLEIEGVDYYFVDNSQASELIKKGEYVEVSPVHGRLYGVTAHEIRRARDSGKIAIADVDVQGVAKYKKVSDNVIAIFLVPPSYQEWKRRVSMRYLSQERFLEDWPNRQKSAIVELERALNSDNYHFVINENLDEAVKSCMKIAHSQNKFVRKDDEIRLRTKELLEQLRLEVGLTKS